VQRGRDRTIKIRLEVHSKQQGPSMGQLVHGTSSPFLESPLSSILIAIVRHSIKTTTRLVLSTGHQQVRLVLSRTDQKLEHSSPCRDETGSDCWTNNLHHNSAFLVPRLRFGQQKNGQQCFILRHSSFYAKEGLFLPRFICKTACEFLRSYFWCFRTSVRVY